MKRDVYSCDWCQTESKIPGFIQSDWKSVETSIGGDGRGGDGREWLCLDCVTAYQIAVKRARVSRMPVVACPPCGGRGEIRFDGDSDTCTFCLGTGRV